MSYLNKEKHTAFLGKLKDQCAYTYLEVQFGGLIPVFIVECENEQQLRGIWQEITSFIASNFQTNLIDEFPTWNIYLFFKVKSAISNSLKYQIENDTFSSRKIIITTEETNDQIINNHIINSLPFNDGTVVNPQAPVFTADINIESILKEKKATGKKQVTEDSRASLETLIQTIKSDEK